MVQFGQSLAIIYKPLIDIYDKNQLDESNLLLNVDLQTQEDKTNTFQMDNVYFT